MDGYILNLTILGISFFGTKYLWVISIDYTQLFIFWNAYTKLSFAIQLENRPHWLYYVSLLLGPSFRICDYWLVRSDDTLTSSQSKARFFLKLEGIYVYKCTLKENERFIFGLISNEFCFNIFNLNYCVFSASTLKHIFKWGVSVDKMYCCMYKQWMLSHRFASASKFHLFWGEIHTSENCNIYLP